MIPMWPTSRQKPCFYLACAITDMAYISTIFRPDVRESSVWVRHRIRIGTVDIDGADILQYLEPAVEQFSNFPLDVALHLSEVEPLKPPESVGRIKGEGGRKGPKGAAQGKGPPPKGRGRGAQDVPTCPRPQGRGAPIFDAWQDAANRAQGQGKGRPAGS